MEAICCCQYLVSAKAIVKGRPRKGKHDPAASQIILQASRGKIKDARLRASRSMRTIQFDSRPTGQGRVSCVDTLPVCFLSC